MGEKKRWKKQEILLPGILIALLAAVVLIPSAAMEEQKSASGIVTTEKVIDSGKVTDTVTWKVIEDETGSQTLVIGGTGPMADYGKKEEQPEPDKEDKPDVKPAAVKTATTISVSPLSKTFKVKALKKKAKTKK